MTIEDLEGASVPTESKVFHTLSHLRKTENPQKVGRNPAGRWSPHPSPEGGTDTVGYGHKLTPEEDKTGKINIGGELVHFRVGLDDTQVEQLLRQDYDIAATTAKKIPKWDMLTPNQQTVVIDSIFNIGRERFTNSLAWKEGLMKGDWDRFLFELADKEQGFVKMTDKKTGKKVFSRGLYRRRQDMVRMWHSDAVTA